ncbi:hypothetical protein B7463_g8741, partial [Scytalidium lignicola]
MAETVVPSSEKAIEIVHEEDQKQIFDDDTGGILGASNEIVTFDPEVSRRVIRKYDRWLLPFFFLINLFCFIDRINIGNARLLGLSTDLGLVVGLRYNIALMCLFVSYCVVELPANIACKKIGGHLWIPFLVFTFGLVTMLTAVVESRGGLYAIRFVLGCLEGGISPGLVFLLAQFYRRRELGFRLSVYSCAASASGAFGGLFAIALDKIPPWGMINTWRNIFFFEGLISIIIGAVGFYLIPAGPVEARFLSDDEKTVAVNRLRVDAAGTTEQGTKLKHVLQAMKSPHTLGCGLGFFFANSCAQTFSVFSPLIIAAMGYTDTRAQLLSVGPYATAATASVILGYLSDKYKRRGIPIMCITPLAITGFFMLEFLPKDMPGAKYGALFLVAPGAYACLPIWLAWGVNNAATPTVRASATAVVYTLANLGGIVSPYACVYMFFIYFLRGNAQRSKL